MDIQSPTVGLEPIGWQRLGCIQITCHNYIKLKKFIELSNIYIYIFSIFINREDHCPYISVGSLRQHIGYKDRQNTCKLPHTPTLGVRVKYIFDSLLNLCKFMCRIVGIRANLT